VGIGRQWSRRISALRGTSWRCVHSERPWNAGAGCYRRKQWTLASVVSGSKVDDLFGQRTTTRAGSRGLGWSGEGRRSKIIHGHQAILSPFDEGKLRLVREFLQREFRSSVCRDYFAIDKNAQMFTIEGSRVGQILVIPEATFDHPDFCLLLNGHLVTVLNSAEGIPVTLTPQGPRY
jgi:hypothetical protein